MSEQQVVERPDLIEVWHCEQPEVYVVTDNWFDFSTEPPTRHIYVVEER